MLVLLTQKYSIFLINDDVLIDRMLSGRDSGQPSNIVPFISIILAKFLSSIYSVFGINISLFGLLLIFTNILSIMLLINMSVYLKDYYKIAIGFFLVFIIIPTTLIAPTFTITSFLAQGVGIVSIALYKSNNGKNIYFYALNILLIVIGFGVRPETSFGILLFIFPILTLYLFKISRHNFKFVLSLWFFYLFLNIFEKLAYYLIINKDSNSFKYLQFIDLRGSLSFTPAFLRTHQLIIEGEIVNSPFSNVDFILLQSWHTFDSTVFNYENLVYVINFVTNLIGFQGVINSNLFQVLDRINLEANSFYKFFILLVIIFIIFSLNLMRKSNFLFFITLTFSYGIGLYYLSAVARLPYRTLFPLGILLILATFLLFNIKEFKKISFISLVSILCFFSVNFHLNDEFGFKKIISSNKGKLNFFTKRDKILHEGLSNKYVLISSIDNLPHSIQGTIFKNLNWKSSENLISLDWTVNSPSWSQKVSNLGFNSNNLFRSLATEPNLYYAGNKDMANILDFYMNDRKILRGKLCPIANLNGLDIFTYQAKENDC